MLVHLYSGAIHAFFVPFARLSVGIKMIFTIHAYAIVKNRVTYLVICYNKDNISFFT